DRSQSHETRVTDQQREGSNRRDTRAVRLSISRKGTMMDASQIKEHMDVVSSDNQHVGTVDNVEGQKLKLTRKDPSAGGEHHYIDLSMVNSVQDGRVKLSCTAEQARQTTGSSKS